MNNILLTFIIYLGITNYVYSQGSWSQTTTQQFNQNVNFNINTYNNEMKLTIDVGDGADGDIYVPSGATTRINSIKSFVIGMNPSGQNVIQVNSTIGFNNGDEVLIISMFDRNVDPNNNIAGQFEFKKILNRAAGALVFTENLTNNFDSTGKSHQVIKVLHYNNITIDVGGTLTCDDWDGLSGGILVFRAKGVIRILGLGKIDVLGKGYQGGSSITSHYTAGLQGQGIYGLGTSSRYSNMNGGGGGGTDYWGDYGGGGGGGAYSTVGLNGTASSGITVGEGGQAVGTQFMSKIFLGGAGGSGSEGPTSGKGGDGGGIILINADSISIVGYINANGENGGNAINHSWSGGGGGGAGGSIVISSIKKIDLGNNFVTATNGNGGMGTHGDNNGGNGGLGRIRIDAPSIMGSSIPAVGYAGTSFANLGTSISQIITKPSLQYWNIISFTRNISDPGTQVKIDILNSSDQILLSDVQSGTNLHYAGLSQNINNIKLKARLINILGNQTPILYDWSVEWTTSYINVISTEIPKESKLLQNYPNPFNPTTNIKFDLPKKSFVNLIIYNPIGQKVATLVNEEMNVGSYRVDWDASNYPSGVYFYKLETRKFSDIKRMILLK